ncbi:hypothetical protein [Thermoanaerobacter sp. YS13]|uniref:hypothetical protein n=1 Tax=Thermoanaerobacter sp. YS13 TaxID=1511746 RepID=UPI0005B46622|nr:hypothetical protein [Thermoanaerobacter sp. YS13]
MLEYIAQELGPFGLEGRNCDYSCRSNFIYDEKQIGSADFDLIFFNRESAEYYEDCIYIKEDEGEFIECKTDVRTFISEELSHTSQKKLNFIKSVYESLKVNPKCLFFIVTFRKNVAIYEDILKKNNYEFISIISGKELLNKV